MSGQAPSAGRQLGPWLLLLGVIVLIGIVVWAIFPGGTRAEPGFYEAAAQITPVIILALAVEGLWRDWGIAYRVVVLIPLVVGEIAALSAAALAKEVTKAVDDLEKGDHAVACSAKLADIWGGETCSRTLTDVLGGLTVFGLTVGFAAVILTTVTKPRTSQIQRGLNSLRVE